MGAVGTWADGRCCVSRVEQAGPGRMAAAGQVPSGAGWGTRLEDTAVWLLGEAGAGG